MESKCPITVLLLSLICEPLHWGRGLRDSSFNPVTPPMVITYLVVLSCLRVDDGKSLIDGSNGQKIYICTKRLHYLSEHTLPLRIYTTHTNKQCSQPANPRNGPVAPQWSWIQWILVFFHPSQQATPTIEINLWALSIGAAHPTGKQLIF